MDNKEEKYEFIITIKDLNTGEVKDVIDERILKEGESEEDLINGVEFMWNDGNYACDCNRYTFFYEDYDTDHPCGGERFELFKVRIKNRVLFLEGKWLI